MSPPAMHFEEQISGAEESIYQKGVKYLCQETGSATIKKVPGKYILPVSDRPNLNPNPTLNLPVIDFAELLGPNRTQVIKSLHKACQEFGFFQVVKHGIAEEIISEMINASRKFFDLPFSEREKYMSSDMYSPVRYGTSVNQTKDKIFCWRDFLKLTCSHPLQNLVSSWPSSPLDFRETAANYSKHTKSLYLLLIEAILESLGLLGSNQSMKETQDLKEFLNESQLMVVNYYPKCPEPDLTLGMAPHSDYGLLTLVLQDEVKGLQIQHQGKWLTVQPIPNSFLVNVGDHLEIFSNGRYKSVLHRVVVNSTESRISIASFHSLPFTSMVRPSPKLLNEANPRRYKDTDFTAFLQYISSREPKTKNFLESRKL
ncbi:hypothetical protein M9H77_34535 [Catharanthus roseus]|uniref:Uncharacterized protein n=1 Tax=Catharanthus roseus TaxID=4058 RepID=A0ACB9ZLQ2_CATRO|nr:hypothetical protein M9H77_34535 [Catharanthus roseus]